MFWYSAKVLSKILQDVPFLALKTIKTDIYGRVFSVCFFAEKLPNDKSKLTIELDVQNVADSGFYLNQLLLDKGVVEIF